MFQRTHLIKQYLQYSENILKLFYHVESYLFKLLTFKIYTEKKCLVFVTTIAWLKNYDYKVHFYDYIILSL